MRVALGPANFLLILDQPRLYSGLAWLLRTIRTKREGGKKKKRGKRGKEGRLTGIWKPIIFPQYKCPFLFMINNGKLRRCAQIYFVHLCHQWSKYCISTISNILNIRLTYFRFKYDCISLFCEALFFSQIIKVIQCLQSFNTYFTETSTIIKVLSKARNEGNIRGHAQK